MKRRIVVGKRLGSGSEPFRLLGRETGHGGWRRVPDVARGASPTVRRIIAERGIHLMGARR